MVVYSIIMPALAVLAGGYVYLLVRRIMKFFGFDPAKISCKIISIMLSLAAVFCCANIWTTRAMVAFHIIAISLLLDGAAMIIRIFCKKKQTASLYGICRKVYRCGILPIVITGVVLIGGFMNMGHVVKTEYSMKTDKNVGNYKVVLITDIHYATIQDTDILKEKITEINAQKPDLVILGGDIVEEDTTKKDMMEVFRRLGGISSKYGVYYVYGNHDRQPYSGERSYTDEELNNAISENGITILEDNYIEIQNNLVIAGRGDAAWGNASGRKSTQEILEGVDREKFIIMADHQPVEAEENSVQGVDLQLSGHTHAGQIWPVGCLSELTGILNYGEYQIEGCKVIVSSGFTGWGYPIRTERKCEYVIVSINESISNSAAE